MDLPSFTLEELEQQESLEFDSFSNEDAFELGTVAANLIRERDLDMCVDIAIGGDLVYRAIFKNTGPDNDPWLAGKAAVTRRFNASSFLVKHRHLAAGTPFEELPDIDHSIFKAHGGAFPIRVAGSLVGTITMSGEPDAIDHATVVDAVRQFLNR